MLAVLVFSCASTQYVDEQQSLRNSTINGEYQKSLTNLEKNKSFKKDNSRLLYFLEKGLILHLIGDYEQSAKNLEKAKEIHQALYTESISKKFETLLINDASDNYSGETYERSMIHYYLALNYLLLYQEKGLSIFSSRAEVLAWDSFLRDQIDEKKGETVFKNDLLAKVFGGIIHEMVGTSEEKQISKQLYKDAKVLLFKNYNSYPSFNKKYKEFNKNFKKFPDMNEEDVQNDFVEETDYHKDVKNFISQKISSKKYNVSIILENGIIPPKSAKVIFFPIGSFLMAYPNDSLSSEVNNYGYQDVFSYAHQNLGFKTMPKDYSYDSKTGYSSPMFGDLAISFEVPEIKNIDKKVNLTLEISGNSPSTVKKEKFFLLCPLGDIAENALEENSDARNLRLGFRLSSKYLAIIVSSFATYNALKKSTSPQLASFLALTEYYLALKVVESLEKADLRQWTTLPQNIYLTTTLLSPGEYKLKVIMKDPRTGEENQRFLGNINVDNSSRKLLVKYRIFD